MTLAAVAERAAAAHLEIFGAFHPGPDDGLPDSVGTLVLLGPSEPGFWSHVTASPEFRDGAPDALDRWSGRVVNALAESLGGTAWFPFDGPPYRPFIAWAKASGRAWSSDVGLLVHDTSGLMVSYRGAIGLPERLPLAATGERPCDRCADKPCLSACPVSALGPKGYDVPSCKAFLHTGPGQDCLTKGCAVRRACPVSRGYARLPEQSAYHMGYFLG